MAVDMLPLLEEEARERKAQGGMKALEARGVIQRQLTAAQKAAVGVDILPLLEEEARERKAQGGIRSPEERGVIERTDTTKEDEVENVVSPDVPILAHLGKSRDQVAETVGVSHGYVTDAKWVKEEAPEVFEGLRAGTLTMRQARATATDAYARRPGRLVRRTGRPWARHIQLSRRSARVAYRTGFSNAAQCVTSSS